MSSIMDVTVRKALEAQTHSWRGRASWCRWAQDWLSGRDHTERSAAKAMETAQAVRAGADLPICKVAAGHAAEAAHLYLRALSKSSAAWKLVNHQSEAT